jgi:hypothetical protein
MGSQSIGLRDDFQTAKLIPDFQPNPRSKKFTNILPRGNGSLTKGSDSIKNEISWGGSK